MCKVVQSRQTFDEDQIQILLHIGNWTVKQQHLTQLEITIWHWIEVFHTLLTMWIFLEIVLDISQHCRSFQQVEVSQFLCSATLTMYQHNDNLSFSNSTIQQAILRLQYGEVKTNDSSGEDDNETGRWIRRQSQLDNDTMQRLSIHLEHWNSI